MHYRLLIFVFISSLLNVANLQAQSYHSALGMRIGTDIGFTYQQRIARYQTIETIIQNRWFRQEGQLAALWEYHNPLVTRGINFYYGIGPQFGWKEDQDGFDLYYSAGIAGIVGAELTLGKIVVSFDIKPNINAIGVKDTPISPFNIDSALSVRTVIVKRSRFSKKRKQKDNKKWNPFKKKKHKI